MHTCMAKPFGILKEEHVGKACVLHPVVQHLPLVYIMNVHFVTQCPTQNRRHLITTILSSKHHFFPERTNNVYTIHLQRFKIAAMHTAEMPNVRKLAGETITIYSLLQKRIMLIYLQKIPSHLTP